MTPEERVAQMTPEERAEFMETWAATTRALNSWTEHFVRTIGPTFEQMTGDLIYLTEVLSAVPEEPSNTTIAFENLDDEDGDDFWAPSSDAMRWTGDMEPLKL